MGMRDGAFALTDPAVFMDSVSNFFAELYYQSYLSVNPDYAFPSDEEDRYFSFDLRDKFGVDNLGYIGYGRRLTIRKNRVPFGTYIPEERWNASQPDAWAQTLYTEEEILQEDLIPYPGDVRGFGGYPLRISLDPEWGEQRYRLIQKMRYCFIPLISPEMRVNFVNDNELGWGGYRKITFRIPDYWRAGGTVHKIAVFIKDTYPDVFEETPPDACKWVTDGEFIIPARADGEVWKGKSQVRIFGCVDLSTHPDFAKYFDIGTNETTKEIQ